MAIRSLPIIKYKDGAGRAVDDDVAVEEPLEIYVDGTPYAVTMRMPGDDLNLAAGFLLTEGIIDSTADLESLAPCEGAQAGFRVLAQLAAQKPVPERKSFVSRSSCGVCGKTALEEIYSDLQPVTGESTVSAAAMQSVKSVFEAQKQVFPLTGASHSVALFDAGLQLLSYAEDVGRHNAMDKAIGAVLRQDRQSEIFLAAASSRLSFEMVQKAAVAGAQVLAGVSAATTLAVAYAERLNITLIGFLRHNRMNVYSHRERITD